MLKIPSTGMMKFPAGEEGDSAVGENISKVAE
jgi:hypothetical protein